MVAADAFFHSLHGGRPESDGVLLAQDRRPFAGCLPLAVQADAVRFGAVSRRDGPSIVRRAEPGPAGPLLLEARVSEGSLHCAVWGPRATPGDHVDSAVRALRAWTGQEDRPRALDPLVANSRVLRRLLLRVGEVRLGRLPRVYEALGRAIIHQLVQRTEAERSVAQVAHRFGGAPIGGLTAWPTARRLGAVPAWELRRCGISQRAARALHAGAVRAADLQSASHEDMPTLDAKLRLLPGVGVWTSAETRLAMGDADAVSVGDYNLHSWVTYALAGVDPTESSDRLMLELLAPFAPQRGRVVTLISRAIARGLLEKPPRRAPRARLSAHHYW